MATSGVFGAGGAGFMTAEYQASMRKAGFDVGYYHVHGSDSSGGSSSILSDADAALRKSTAELINLISDSAEDNGHSDTMASEDSGAADFNLSGDWGLSSPFFDSSELNSGAAPAPAGRMVVGGGSLQQRRAPAGGRPALRLVMPGDVIGADFTSDDEDDDEAEDETSSPVHSSYTVQQGGRGLFSSRSTNNLASFSPMPAGVDSAASSPSAAIARRKRERDASDDASAHLQQPQHMRRRRLDSPRSGSVSPVGGSLKSSGTYMTSPMEHRAAQQGQSADSGTAQLSVGVSPAKPRAPRTLQTPSKGRAGGGKKGARGGGGRSSATHTPPGHVCSACGITHTPLWRAGPEGPKTLCNACGVRYMKSGTVEKRF